MQEDSETPEGGSPPWMGFLEMADRAISSSGSDFTRQVGNLFGEMLAGAVNPQATRQAPPLREKPQEAQKPRESVDEARVTLGLDPEERLTEARIKARRRALAAIYHPDQEGGSTSAMKRVNEAADILLKSL